MQKTHNFEIAFQRDLGRQIMTVRSTDPGKDADVPDFREQMILHNRIDGLLTFSVAQEDSRRIFEYDIEDKTSFAERFKTGKPDRGELTAYLRALLETIYRGREYMLSEDDYIVGPDTVFTDEDGKVYVAYYPGYGEDLKTQLKNLAEYLMGMVDYSDESAVLMIYGFYMKTKEKGCVFEDLIKCLNGNVKNDGGNTKTAAGDRHGKACDNPHGNPCGNLQENLRGNPYETRHENTHGIPEKTMEPADIVMSRSGPIQTEIMPHDITEIRPDSPKHARPDAARVFSESPSKMKITAFLLPLAAVLVFFLLTKSGLLINENTGRNDVIKTGLALIMTAGICYEAEKIMWRKFADKLDRSLMSAEEQADEATVFLYGNDTAGYPFSLVSDDQPSINVSHFPFFIGKDANHCDYVMASQIGISRFHMKIDREGDEFTVSDLNSTNGTFINGERLAPHLPHKVKRGDELRIGKCIYYCN